MRREGQLGFDSRILGALPAQWQSAVLQYKRPYDAPRGQSYVFEINNNTHNDQHDLLQHFCGGAHAVAFYVLPTYLNLIDVHRNTPHLIRRTYLADVMDIPASVVDRTSHDLEVLPAQSTGIIHSEKVEIRLQKPENLLASIHDRKAGLTLGTLRENMKTKLERTVETSRSRFNFISFPRSEGTKPSPRLGRPANISPETWATRAEME
jgi:hypothetical protein